MEVSIRHRDSGKTEVFAVDPSETVHSLTLKAVRELCGCSSDAEARPLAAQTDLCPAGSSDAVGGKLDHIADTTLEHGDEMELVRHGPLAPCLYPHSFLPAASKIAVSHDSMLCAVGHYGGCAAVWDTSSGEKTLEVRLHDINVLCVAISPDSSTLCAGGNDGALATYRIPTGDLVHRLKGHSGGVFSAAWSPCGKQVVTASTDKSVYVWNAASGKHSRTFKPHTGGLVAAVVTEDVIITAGGQDLSIWSREGSGNAVAQLCGHHEAVSDIAVAGVGVARAVSSDYGSNVLLWDTEAHALLTTIATRAACLSVAISSDGGTIAAFDRGHEVSVWSDAGAPQSVIPAPEVGDSKFYYGVGLSGCGFWLFYPRSEGVHVVRAR